MASRNRLLPVWGLHLGIHVVGYTRGGVYTWVGTGYFLCHGQKKISNKRFLILSANPTWVFSLETSLRTISPENTGTCLPDKIKKKKKFMARCGFKKKTAFDQLNKLTRDFDSIRSRSANIAN